MAVTSQAAKQVADKIGVRKIYANSRGEYFTDFQNAKLSENNDATKVQSFDFSNDPEDGTPAPPPPPVYVLTASDIKKNPDFKTAGLKAGDGLSFNPNDDISPEQLRQLLGLTQKAQ